MRGLNDFAAERDRPAGQVGVVETVFGNVVVGGLQAVVDVVFAVEAEACFSADADGAGTGVVVTVGEGAVGQRVAVDRLDLVDAGPAEITGRPDALGLGGWAEVQDGQRVGEAVDELGDDRVLGGGTGVGEVPVLEPVALVAGRRCTPGDVEFARRVHRMVAGVGFVVGIVALTRAKAEVNRALPDAGRIPDRRAGIGIDDEAAHDRSEEVLARGHVGELVGRQEARPDRRRTVGELNGNVVAPELRRRADAKLIVVKHARVRAVIGFVLHGGGVEGADERFRVRFLGNDADPLDGWQENADQQGDDADHDEQFRQREARRIAPSGGGGGERLTRATVHRFSLHFQTVWRREREFHGGPG